MSDLEQLEQQVLQLSPEDLAKFRVWFIGIDRQLLSVRVGDYHRTLGIDEGVDINWI